MCGWLTVVKWDEGSALTGWGGLLQMHPFPACFGRSESRAAKVSGVLPAPSDQPWGENQEDMDFVSLRACSFVASLQLVSCN